MSILMAFILGLVLGGAVYSYSFDTDTMPYNWGEFQQQLDQFQQRQNILQGRNPVTGQPLQHHDPC
jgi:hypothetical protein